MSGGAGGGGAIAFPGFSLVQSVLRTRASCQILNFVRHQTRRVRAAPGGRPFSLGWHILGYFSSRATAPFVVAQLVNQMAPFRKGLFEKKQTYNG